jgi:hypothetical protein
MDACRKLAQQAKELDGAQPAVQIQDAVICVLVLGEKGDGVGDLAGVSKTP